MKIVSVVGARPQFVKAAVVSRALARHPALHEVVVHTGQHYDSNLSDIFFDELGMAAPDYHLGVGSGTHGRMTGQMMGGIEDVLLEENPDWLLVYGDTNSTLAGGLAAAKLNIPVAHVEAGLRSFNRRMPEEINRVLCDHVSTALFAPTAAAMSNLAREGIDPGNVHLVGDVMYDAALYYSSNRQNNFAARFGLDTEPYVLATIHRAENTDDPVRLRAVVGALQTLTKRIRVIMPLHPRTRAAMERQGLVELIAGSVQLIDPIGYLDMIEAEAGAKLIVTDSGGVQKEAFFFRVPCVTLRGETEWVELVEWGWNQLLPPDSKEQLVTGLERALDEPIVTAQMPADCYGGGTAGERIAEILAGRGSIVR